MKRVPRLHAEPPLLRTFRTNRSRTQNLNLRRRRLNATSLWNMFKRFMQKDAYRELRDRLRMRQQGLCVYCEQRLVDSVGNLVGNDYQVEHILAKSGAINRVLDWTNLALACMGGIYDTHTESSRFNPALGRNLNISCGQKKDNINFPCGIDPRDFPLLDALVFVKGNGELVVNAANCASAGIEERELTCVINGVLNLNCERLRMARQNVYSNINNLFNSIMNDVSLDGDEKNQLIEYIVSSRLSPDSYGYLIAFWSTERSALREAAEQWIASNQRMFL